MKIGLIRPFEIEYNPRDIEDLQTSAKSMGHQISDVFVDKIGVHIGKEIRLTQIGDRNHVSEVDVDCAFLRHLGMPRDYEQFCSRLWTVRAMEQNDIYVMNSITSWMLASDKFAALAILAKKGIPVPDTFISEDAVASYGATKAMGEVVIKQLRGAMGFGVFKIDDPDLAMHAFSYLGNMSKPIYVQKFLNKKGGGDYRVVVVDGKVLGAEFRKGKDWKSNIAQGGKPTAAKVTTEMEEIALKCTDALRLDYAGIDIAQTKDGYFVLEVNPTISWQGFRLATKIDVPSELIAHLVKKVKN